MRRIVNLAVLAGLLYLGYTYGLPWLQQLKQSSADDEEMSSATSASTECVGETRYASEALASELLPLARPRADRALWGNALVSVGSSLTRADNACRCGTDACLTASQAISELRRMVEQLNSAVRGGAPALDLAQTQERVDQLLTQAKRQIGK